MKKILIVDDDRFLRILYEMELSAMGYKVLFAESGVEAIEKVRKENPNAVVLDLVLPDMSGLDVLQGILSINSHLPVIINSAYTHYKENFMCWAAEDFVVKSSDLSDLKYALERVLENDEHLEYSA
ncbi:response regulator [candidate division KSB1 bacterium]|nr:response regulator [candidate division KSB1 bacterium]